MPTEKQRLTFISYSRADKDFALQLARELRSSGFLIWFDQWDIPTGARWDDEVEKALVRCEIFMVILTPRSIASNNVKDEIGYAINSSKRIMPVLLENANVPLRLSRFQYVDFTKKSYEEGIESAKQLLRNLLNEPTSPNIPPVPERPPSDRRSPPPPNKTLPMLIGVAMALVICLILARIAWPYISGQTTDPSLTPPVATAANTDVPDSPATTEASPVFTPTDTPTPIPVSTISPDPGRFIEFYFENINERNYELTWSLLSRQYQEKQNPGGIEQYKEFWNGYSKVEVRSVHVIYSIDTSARVSLEATYYKGNSAKGTESKTTHYLISDNSEGGWLFDNAPVVAGSASDVTCKEAPKRLSVGVSAQVVTESDSLLLRDNPMDGAGLLEQLPPRTIVTVIDGPTCNLYHSVYFWWWKVKAPSGNVGWVIEGSDVKDRIFILPVH